MRSTSPAAPSRGSRRRWEGVFVVRVWREAGAPHEALRCSVDDVGGKRQAAFASLDELFAYLSVRSDPQDVSLGG
jgi:hypothetical protein